MAKQSDITPQSVIKVQGLPVVMANFNWSTGSLMEKFIKTLSSKKIIATKCPKCGYTHVPPRRRCVKCRAKVEEGNISELSGKGTLLGYTLAKVELDGKGTFVDLDEPVIIAAIKLEDADSTIFVPLVNVKPDEVTRGMDVKVKWVDGPMPNSLTFTK